MRIRLQQRLAPFLVVVCLCCGCNGSGYEPAPGDVQSRYKQISVEGSADFVRQINQALALIDANDPASMMLINSYIGRITEAPRSGMLAYDDPPTLELSDEIAGSSMTYCASCIVHDAFHSKLYHDYLEQFGAPVPQNVWCGKDAELQCISRQIQSLEVIGAPAAQIEYLQGLDGTYDDVNGDGQIDWSDYFQRNW